MIKLLIYFRAAFIQGFLMLSDNLVTSERFLGSEMNPETSEPDSPKIGNAWKISLTTALNTLCKCLPIFFVYNNASLHYALPCLIQSRILLCAYVLFMIRWYWIPSKISSNISVDIGSFTSSIITNGITTDDVTLKIIYSI